VPYLKTVEITRGDLSTFEAIAEVSSSPFSADELGGTVAERFITAIPLKPPSLAWFNFEFTAPANVTQITDPTDLGLAQVAVEAIQGGAPPTGPVEVFTPSTGLSQFANTLADALALSSAEDVWRLAPGTYTGGVTLNIPLIIEPQKGTARVTIVPPDDNTDALFFTQVGSSVLRNIEVATPGNAVGVKVQNANAVVAIDRCYFLGTVAPSSGICAQVVQGRLDVTARYMGGFAAVFLDAMGPLSFLNAQVCSMQSGTVGVGIREGGGANVFAARFDVVQGNFSPALGDAISVAEGDVLVVDSIISDAVLGMRITADGGEWTLQNVAFIRCTRDAVVEPGLTGAGSLLAVQYCRFSAYRFVAPAAWFTTASFSGVVFDTYFAEPTQRIVGAELSVGFSTVPTETSTAGGDSTPLGMVVKRNTNLDVGVWDDITDDVFPGGGGSPIFPGTGVGNAIYFGFIRTFPGVKVNWTVAGTGLLCAGPNPNCIAEVYTSNGWEKIGIMASKAIGDLLSRGPTLAGVAESQQIRVGVIADETEVIFSRTWDDAVPLVLDGSEPLYWMRWRIFNATVSTIPETDAVKIHTSRFEDNAQGPRELFGLCERRNEALPQWGPGSVTDNPQSPGNEAVDISSRITLTPADNEFINGNTDRINGSFRWPRNIDSAYPLRLNMELFQTTNTAAGLSVWEIAIAKKDRGDLNNGIANEYIRRFDVGALGRIPVPGTDNERFGFDVDLDLNGFFGGIVPGEVFYMSVGRLAGDANDNFEGNIAYSETEAQATFYK